MGLISRVSSRTYRYRFYRFHRFHRFHKLNMNANDKDSTEMIANMEKKITSAFKVFDHESNNTIDVREVGTVVRSLGLVPTEAELQDLIISECEDDEDNGTVRLEKFVLVMSLILTGNKMKPASEERLLQAWQVLDTDNKGYLTEDEITNFMTKEGEPFSQEEMTEMLEAAIDPDTGKLNYRTFLNNLIIDEKKR